MRGHVPLVVIILNDLTLYPSKLKELSNGTQQEPLGSYAMLSLQKFTKFGPNLGRLGQGGLGLTMSLEHAMTQGVDRCIQNIAE